MSKDTGGAAKRTYQLLLTESELDLVRTEFHASICNGAEDPDFERVYDKAVTAFSERSKGGST